MPKRPQVKSWKQDTIPESKMILRMVEVRRETANDDDRSIEVVVASENPVERFDEESGDVIREILSMDGIQWRNDKRKLPIVDSHDRSTIRNVLGTVRGLATQNGQLGGRAFFADDEDSQNAYRKLKDGHLDDFSITATPSEIENIRRGETGMWRDEEIEGPVDIVHGWMPTDASLVAVGADETSTQRGMLRRSYYDLNRKVSRMTDEQRTALVGRGMPVGATDEEAMEFAIQLMAPEEEEVEQMDEDSEDIEKMDDEETIEKMDDEDTVEKMDDEEIESSVDRAKIEAGMIKRQKEIRALCTTHRISRKFADTLCDDPKVTLPIARKRILKKMETKPLGNGGDRIEFGSMGVDRMRDAMRDGMIHRAAVATGKRKNPFATEYDPNAKPAEGYQEFGNMTLLRTAEAFLSRQGVNTNRMGSKDLAMVALGHQPTIERLGRTAGIRRDDAWHTTGSFTNLLLDAINKELRDGYEEPPYTWDVWAKQGTSVQDTKDIHRIQYSEYPDLQDVPEGSPYPERKTSDAKETYKPGKKGGLFTITWETIVNDDLDAISRIPQMQGVAARRKQNKSVYAVLTDNAVMADTGTLFNATAVTTAGGHNNHITTGTVISETTLNAAFASMMIQPNLGGEIAGAIPRYLIVPPGISATALQIVESMTPPTVGGDTTGTSGTKNLYGPGGPRTLEVVVEPQLQSNSATAWYLAADKSSIDTVELTFLSGEETPVLESEWDLKTDVFTYKIRQTYGVAAIDWRGLYKNDGA